MSAPASTRATEFEWIEQAACKGTDPELFFPRGADEAFGDAAREICRRCPVLATCLSYALHWDVDGVWGATSKAERATLRARHRLTAHPVEIHAPDASLRAQIEAMSRGGGFHPGNLDRPPDQ